MKVTRERNPYSDSESRIVSDDGEVRGESEWFRTRAILVCGPTATTDDLDSRTSVGHASLEATFDEIARQGAPVSLVAFDKNVRFRTMPSLRKFPALEYFQSEAKKVTDWSRSDGSLGQLKRLYIDGYKGENLRRFGTRRFDDVRLVRGNIQRVDAGADAMLLQQLRELRGFDDVIVTQLTMESCPSVDLDELQNIRGLKGLDLLNMPVRSLSFAVGLLELERLTLTAKSWFPGLDISPLSGLPRLRKVFLPCGVPNLREIAKSLPSTIELSNGGVTLSGAVETTRAL